MANGELSEAKWAGQANKNAATESLDGGAFASITERFQVHYLLKIYHVRAWWNSGQRPKNNSDRRHLSARQCGRGGSDWLAYLLVVPRPLSESRPGLDGARL